MKDTHDRQTIDLATVDPTFCLYPVAWRPSGHYTQREWVRIRAMNGYMHEKPYLTEALRRSVK